MKALPRLLCVPGALACIVFTQAPVLAGFPASLPPGDYHNTSQMATFYARTSANLNLNLSVTNSNNVTAPVGAPATTTHLTRLYISSWSPSSYGGGCYDIAA